MRTRRMVPVLALAVVLGLTACGSDDAGSAALDSTAEPTEAAMGDEQDESGDEAAMDGADEAGDEDATEDEGAGPEEDAVGDDASDEADGAEASGPEITGTTLDGEPFDGADVAGQPVALWFWAPWCTKCIAQAPAVLSLAAEYEGEVQIIGVAGEASEAEMPEFVERTNTGGLTHLADPDGEIWRQYGVTETSTFVFLDVDGEPVDSGRFSDNDLADRVAALS
ncbi:redoxin domain-containing protein [Phytoactinopolyspora mesophila]|uniref:Redoxin domain-containing protein n=1 Tax=Phytoactinopolyspora mesophila TaxID=2650750 RepID=A0A7K3M3Z9_9ACTN|nr:redoxin domain-containing protein [Phytoactinopolyspora mesophila]NDL57976.1 redoxin domain-containing protein [Phytoactinopolyspora mesophila]